MGIVTGIFYGIVFVLGVGLAGMGMYGINNRRFGVASVFLILGLGVVIWSGQTLHQRFFMSQVDRRIAETAAKLDKVRGDQGRIEKLQKSYAEQTETLIDKLRDKAKTDSDLAARMVNDADLSLAVRKLVQLRRWRLSCDRALGHLAETAKGLEASLFFLKNTKAAAELTGKDLDEAVAKEVAEVLEKEAATPEGGSAPLPPSDTELQDVQQLMKEGK